MHGLNVSLEIEALQKGFVAEYAVISLEMWGWQLVIEEASGVPEFQTTHALKLPWITGQQGVSGDTLKIKLGNQWKNLIINKVQRGKKFQDNG